MFVGVVKLREMDIMAVESVKDEKKLISFIRQNEFFILKTASKISKHYISKNDDEWSVALVAFSGAVKKYDYDKGSFFSFAELVIKKNLIDYYRSNGKRSMEIPVECIHEEVLIEHSDNNLKLEIEAISEVLSEYGFGFMDLADCSPKADKTRKACAKAVSYLMTSPVLIGEMRKSKLFPLKIIEKNTGVPRKILERHRKYLIAAAEILSGDCPYLSDYLSFIKEVNL